MPLALDLAIRFLRRRSGGLLRGTALAAFAAVALAVAVSSRHNGSRRPGRTRCRRHRIYQDL